MADLYSIIFQFAGLFVCAYYVLNNLRSEQPLGQTYEKHLEKRGLRGTRIYSGENGLLWLLKGETKLGLSFRKWEADKGPSREEKYDNPPPLFQYLF